MKKKLLFMALLLQACVSVANAEVVLIGDGGTAQKSGLPIATNWKYNLSEQIYTVAEVGRSGIITSIAFKSCEVTLTRTIDLYLVHTEKSSYSSGTDWVTGSENDKVFSGAVTFEKGEWTTITFDKSFAYDGTRNLCVIVNDKSNVVNSSTQWLVYDAASQSHVRYNDNNPYNPASPGSTGSADNSLRNYKNQLQLTFEDSEIVEVGRDDFSLNLLPTNTKNKYSLTQQIYTKEEIGRAGVITSIAFYNADTYKDETRNFDLYLVQTNQTSFGGGKWIPASASAKVFSGSITFRHDCWTTIYFNTPFDYDGQSNLSVIMDDNTGSTVSVYNQIEFMVYNTNKQYHAIYVYSDNTNYNPASPPSGDWTCSYAKNCIQLGFRSESGSDPDPELFTKTVQIGNEQTSDYYLPVNTYYNYSVTQQIYTAAEIGTAGTITSIAFDYAHSQALSMSGVQMYMKNVSKSVFDSRSDMVSVGASDLVWEGTLSAPEAGWVTITLNKPFKYDGKSNLLLCLYDPTNGYPGSAYTFRYTETEENRTLSYWSDSNTPDLGSLTSFSGSAGIKQYRSNIKLNIQTTGSGLDFIDFETGDFSQSKFQNDSEHPWIVTNATAADGTYCMKSGNGGVASSSSAITATRTYEESGYICFDAKCMGEGTAWDVCNFYIDDERQFSYGALGNYWAFYYYPVTTGSHTFKWEYVKDSTTNPEGDAFFVDNIRFLQGSSAEDIIVGVKDLKDSNDLKNLKDIYNLAGQRLSKTQKGINIVNGRKVLVR